MGPPPTYPLISRIIRLLFIIVWGWVTLRGGQIWINDLKLHLDGSNTTQTDLLLSGIAIFLATIATLLFMNWDPAFVLTRDGIEVQVFIFWKTLIPWNDVVEVRPSILPFPRLHLIVVKKGLTFVHHIYGLMFGLTSKPGIFVRGLISGYDEAIKSIRAKVRERTLPED